MRTYQALALVGGGFGLAVVPAILLVFGLGAAFMAALDADGATDAAAAEQGMAVSLAVAAAASAGSIALAFAVRSRMAGFAMIGLAAAMAAATHAYGAVSWIFLLAAGIAAARYRG